MPTSWTVRIPITEGGGVIAMKMIRILVVVSLIVVLAGTYIYLYLKEGEKSAVSTSPGIYHQSLIV